MRVLVTGASGFIGGILCGELASRGHEVSALIRRPGSEPRGARPVAGELGWARLVAGSNAVAAVTRSARSSNRKIKAELGWAPRFATASAGIPDVVAHL